MFEQKLSSYEKYVTLLGTSSVKVPHDQPFDIQRHHGRKGLHARPHHEGSQGITRRHEGSQGITRRHEEGVARDYDAVIEGSQGINTPSRSGSLRKGYYTPSRGSQADYTPSRGGRKGLHAVTRGRKASHTVTRCYKALHSVTRRLQQPAVTMPYTMRHTALNTPSQGVTRRYNALQMAFTRRYTPSQGVTRALQAASQGVTQRHKAFT
ncbi:hypothetical protein OS493_039986 [Desmophyllum pertusum]|uniref:Uncharacterized protein n=1 Tax=Desmophyllum pertusum TaxID=174260 RepID=A0A9W9YX15_9CNID|nr:hypothetical protein OS493_039986 [Desmophyllum pertusum]